MKIYKKTAARSFQLNLSLTAAEIEDIKRRAEALGLRPVYFARAVILNGTITVPARSTPESQALRHLRLQLAQLGNLLNQMVRKFHQNNLPPPADLEPLLHDIRTLIARIPQ